MTATIEPFDDVVIRDVLITGTVEVITDDAGRRRAGEIERGLCLDVWNPTVPDTQRQLHARRGGDPCGA